MDLRGAQGGGRQVANHFLTDESSASGLASHLPRRGPAEACLKFYLRAVHTKELLTQDSAHGGDGELERNATPRTRSQGHTAPCWRGAELPDTIL